MTGKANVKKSVIDDIIKLKRQEAKSFGLARQSVSGISSTTVLGSSGMKGSGDINANPDISLKTKGDSMVGPIAYWIKSTTIANGTINVGEADAYSSRVLVIGQGSVADDLEVILNASFAGQVLFLQPIQAVTLQDFTKTAAAWVTSTSYSVGDVVLDAGQRYTCYTAHTSSATTDPSTGATWETVWYRNNIRITGADDYVMAVDEIVQLMFDSTDSVWTVVSGGGAGGVNLLPLNNVWTGTNSFTGGTFSSSATTSTSITSPQIYLGDQASDTINITGAVNVNGDIDMNTYDIFAIDRLKFSTTAGSGSALTSTDTGIEALYNAGVPYGMLIQFPSASGAIMQIKRGTTDMINISSLGILLGDELLMGGFKISNMADPTAAQDAATKAYVDASAGTGFANTSLSNLVSASVSINADLIPDTTGSRNIGGSTKYWGSAFISGRMYFDTGTSKFIDGTTTGVIELQVPSGGQVIFSEAGTDFYTMDGGSNTNTFSRDIWLTSAKAIRASSGVEVGYFVTSTTAAVGSRGSVQIPTANQGVTTAAAADAVFGSAVGCCGMFTISGGQALAVKITSTTWQILQLGVAGSTALPYQI